MTWKKPMLCRLGRRNTTERKASLAQSGWISEGCTGPRFRGAGPACQWTRKVKGKTAKVVLSEEQYEWLNAAIANWRTVQTTLRQMQRLSRRVLLTTIPDIERRQPLSKKARGR